MNRTSSIQGKTIRPGSLKGYTYYYAGRPARPAAKPAARKGQLPAGLGRKLLLTALVAAALIVVPLMRGGDTVQPTVSDSSGPGTTAPAALVQADTVTNHCAGNTRHKFIKVSVSQRHLWACEGSQTVHDAPVITGMLAYPETLTPPGTYHVYAKQTNTTLTGSDSAGSWHRDVHYWMPFLHNEHGIYGFHDATWRSNNEFGAVDAGSSNASHGCVELPLSSQKWLYDWTPLETAVTIES